MNKMVPITLIVMFCFQNVVASDDVPKGEIEELFKRECACLIALHSDEVLLRAPFERIQALRSMLGEIQKEKAECGLDSQGYSSVVQMQLDQEYLRLTKKYRSDCCAIEQKNLPSDEMEAQKRSLKLEYEMQLRTLQCNGFYFSLFRPNFFE